jgi:hypothetical protein
LGVGERLSSAVSLSCGFGKTMMINSFSMSIGHLLERVV